MGYLEDQERKQISGTCLVRHLLPLRISSKLYHSGYRPVLWLFCGCGWKPCCNRLAEIKRGDREIDVMNKGRIETIATTKLKLRICDSPMFTTQKVRSQIVCKITQAELVNDQRRPQVNL